MDGLSVLYRSTPEFQPLLYSRGNAVGWLSRSDKTAAAPYNLCGRLYLAKSGWLLLSVPNAFVRGVFDALTAPGAELPTTGLMNVPNVEGDVLNAHISVMTAAEVEQIGADKINERGHMFHYALGPVEEIPVHNVEGVSKVWAVQIKSPALAALRKSYGLSPYINNNHQFHITVAARRKNVLGNNEVSKFDAATGRGEWKAAADDKTTYDCCCSGPCMCPPTCICKKSGYCGHSKKEAAADPATTILVSGHSGAGKSTLSKALAEKLKIPLHQIDSHPDQKAFFAVNKDGQETVVGSPVYEEFQKLRKRTAEETLAGINGPAIVEGAQLSALSPEQLSAYKNRVFVHTPLKQLLKQRLERQRTRQLAKGNEWTPELENKKQQIGRAVYDVQNSLMRQYARLPGTLKYTTRKDDIDALISKLTKSADLLPGGAADNKPDSAFPEKELQKGIKHEHEHTDNNQIATEIAKDHLQEEPDYYKKRAEEEVKEPAIIFQLRKAKEHSDAKRYKQKNEILRKLMHRAPDEWFVDDPTKYHMGITHAPTKFRFHADPQIIPVGVPVQKAASKNPYIGHLFDFREPLPVSSNSNLWQKTIAHLQRVVDKGNWTAQARQNAHGLFAAMDPNYKNQMNMALVRGEWPKPDLMTQLIQRHGSSVLSALK